MMAVSTVVLRAALSVYMMVGLMDASTVYQAAAKKAEMKAA